MIELNDKTQQDFLNREWIQRLLDAGVDMSDAKYCISTRIEDNKDYIFLQSTFGKMDSFMMLKWKDIIPTCTVSELLYKIHRCHCMMTSTVMCNSKLGIIEVLALALLHCHKKDVGMNTKDNINNR